MWPYNVHEPVGALYSSTGTIRQDYSIVLRVHAKMKAKKIDCIVVYATTRPQYNVQ